MDITTTTDQIVIPEYLEDIYTGCPWSTKKYEILMEIQQGIENILREYNYTYNTHHTRKEIVLRINYFLDRYKSKGLIMNDFIIKEENLIVKRAINDLSHYFSDAEEERQRQKQNKD